jgi:pseudaminic acid biosynthesis-associated methylase
LIFLRNKEASVEDLTEQLKEWSGNFGIEYTDRNTRTLKEQEEQYIKNYGVTRISMNEEFLSGMDKDIKILEVGCNIGNQLVLLKQMGFTRLYGIEISDYALEIAKRRKETEGISFIKGSAFDIPFKDASFAMVFTSGVLIHISPDDIKKAIFEIHRCSGNYIWGFEYYAEDYQEVTYRDHKELLWKTDFARMYTDNFMDLRLSREKKYTYLEDEKLTDQMFLLEK